MPTRTERGRSADRAIPDTPFTTNGTYIARRGKGLTGSLAGRRDFAAAAAPAELRAFLAERLPAYLVPDHLVAVAALPRTANGKVDKDDLPAPDPRAEVVAAPARTGTEQRIAEIWQELLGVEAVGAEDDFFGLGGYSLLVATMLARVNETFGRKVPLAVFLTTPTLAGLADAVDHPVAPVVPGPVALTLSDAEAEALLTVLAEEAG